MWLMSNLAATASIHFDPKELSCVAAFADPSVTQMLEVQQSNNRGELHSIRSNECADIK